MERINGVLGGVLAGESFTPAQGYFLENDLPPVSYAWTRLTIQQPGSVLTNWTVLMPSQWEKLALPHRKNAHSASELATTFSLMRLRVRVALLMTGDGRRELLKSYIASKSARLQRGDIKHIARGCAHEYFDPDSPVDWADIDSLIDSTCDKDEVAELDDLVALSKAVKEPRYKLLRSEDIAKLPPLKWRVRGVLPAVGLVAGYGPSGSGKSFLFLDMAAAIAEGRYWFGYRLKVLQLCIWYWRARVDCSSVSQHGKNTTAAKLPRRSTVRCSAIYFDRSTRPCRYSCRDPQGRGCLH